MSEDMFQITIDTMSQVQKCYHIDVIMIKIASQITSLAVVYSFFHSGTDQRKHQSSASVAFVR